MTERRHLVALSGILFLLALSVAGCLHDSTSFLASVHVSDGTIACDSKAVSDCSAIYWADEGRLVIDKVNIDTDPGSISILVEGPYTLEIRDSSIKGGTIAVRWVSDASCLACRLIVDHSDVEAAMLAIHQEGTVGDITISNSRLAVSAEGPSEDATAQMGSGVISFSGAASLHVASTSSIQLKDVLLESPTPSAGSVGIMIHEDTRADITAENVSIQGFDVGIWGPVPTIGPGPVRIQCESRGIIAGGTAIGVEGVQIRGCSGTGIEAGLPTEASFDQIEVMESGIGVRLVNPERVEFNDFRLESNRVGLAMSGGLDRSIRLTGGCILDNERAGAFLNVSTLVIVDSLVSGNGWNNPPQGPTNWETTHGGLILNMFDPSGSWTASGSSFEGNLPFALFHSGYAPVMEASNNWWGSSQGPNVMVSPGVPTPIGAGNQTVAGPVNVVPFLLEPPALC